MPVRGIPRALADASRAASAKSSMPNIGYGYAAPNGQRSERSAPRTNRPVPAPTSRGDIEYLRSNAYVSAVLYYGSPYETIRDRRAVGEASSTCDHARTELWTLKRIGDVIRRQFRVRYSPVGVWALLRHGMGWSWQRPERRAL